MDYSSGFFKFKAKMCTNMGLLTFICQLITLECSLANNVKLTLIQVQKGTCQNTNIILKLFFPFHLLLGPESFTKQRFMSNQISIAIMSPWMVSSLVLKIAVQSFFCVVTKRAKWIRPLSVTVEKLNLEIQSY